MNRDRSRNHQLSEFLRYLAAWPGDDRGRIPPLNELSQELGISVASLREQLEVARGRAGFIDPAGIDLAPAW